MKAYETSAHKAMALMEAGLDHATAEQVLPERYRKRQRTTNGNELLNEEIRRREQMISILPNLE